MLYFCMLILSDVVEAFTLSHSHRLPFLSPTHRCNRFVVDMRRALFRKVRGVRGVCVCVHRRYSLFVKKYSSEFLYQCYESFLRLFNVFLKTLCEDSPPLPLSVTTVPPSLSTEPASIRFPTKYRVTPQFKLCYKNPHCFGLCYDYRHYG